MAKSKKKPPHQTNGGSKAIDYNSSYTWYAPGVAFTPPSPAAFIATMRLGGNSSTGVTEVLLSGVAANLAWGTDSHGNVNSAVNYSTGVPVELDIPASTTPQESTATLTVGNTTVTFSPESSYEYNFIPLVAVQAFTNIAASPTMRGDVQIIWEELVCTFYDANGGVTTNPNVPTNKTPYAQQGIDYPQSNTIVSSAVVIQPDDYVPGGFQPVRVTISGTLWLVSSDPYYQNYGADLSSTSLKAMIWVQTDADQELLITNKSPFLSRRRHAGTGSIAGIDGIVTPVVLRHPCGKPPQRPVR